MLKDITLGQYYPTKSVLHQLDPRVKLAGTFLFLISLFLQRGIVGFILSTLVLAAMIGLSHVPLSYMLRGLKAIFVLLILTAAFHLFLTPGETVVALGKLTITDAGIVSAVQMVVRLIYLILGTSLMTLTTTPNQLTDGLEKAFSPFTKLGLPVHEIALMMSIALRFIPILMEEADKIMKAQMARGADFTSRNLIVRAKNMIPLLVPLFVAAFRRANDLALAMEARCYRGGSGRTKLHPLRYQRRDVLAYFVMLFYLVVIVVCRVWRRK